MRDNAHRCFYAVCQLSIFHVSALSAEQWFLPHLQREDQQTPCIVLSKHLFCAEALLSIPVYSSSLHRLSALNQQFIVLSTVYLLLPRVLCLLSAFLQPLVSTLPTFHAHLSKLSQYLLLYCIKSAFYVVKSSFVLFHFVFVNLITQPYDKPCSEMPPLHRGNTVKVFL